MRNEYPSIPNKQAALDYAFWLYIAHGLSLFFTLGALSFVPLIINYILRANTQDPLLYSHHSWQIRSFWWYLLWALLACALFFTLILIPVAVLLIVIAWCWKAYRLIKGVLYLNRREPMPD